MSTLHLSPKQTLTYDYDPSDDVLSIQLGEAHGPVVQEAVAHNNHLSLRRDAQSGEVVGVVVSPCCWSAWSATCSSSCAPF